jgi:hypothetical protein
MEKVVLLAFSLTLFYGILKFLEMKFIEREIKPLKEIVRDLILVFCSSFIVFYFFIQHQTKLDDFFSVVTHTNILNPNTTQVFTGSPDF